MKLPKLPVVRSERITVGGERLYRIGAHLYPSVTSILSVVGKPALVRWAKRVAIDTVRAEIEFVHELTREKLEEILERALQEPERVRDAAAMRGSAIHEAIADRIAASGFDQRGVLEALGITVLETEYVVYSPTHGFAGTADLIGYRDGGIVLLDWKTGGVWPEHALQLGAYQLALSEIVGEPVVAGYVVGLRDQEPDIRIVDLETAERGFLAALGLYHALRSESLLRPARKKGGDTLSV